MEPSKLRRRHELKTWPEYFRAILCCEKEFEVRKNDRDFQKWDVLILKEWDPETEDYTGREVEAAVTYVLHGGQFGIEPGYVVMGFDRIRRDMCEDCLKLGSKCPSCAHLVDYGMKRLQEILKAESKL